MTGTHQGYKFLSRSARTNLPWAYLSSTQKEIQSATRKTKSQRDAKRSRLARSHSECKRQSQQAWFSADHKLAKPKNGLSDYRASRLGGATVRFAMASKRWRPSRGARVMPQRAARVGAMSAGVMG